MVASTGKAPKRPAIILEDEMDTSFRPFHLDPCYEEDYSESDVENHGLNFIVHVSEWEIDCDALSQDDLSAILCLLGGDDTGAGAAPSAATTEPHSTASATLSDAEIICSRDESWVEVESETDLTLVEDDESVTDQAEWEVLSSTASVMSITSSMADFSYKDALTLGDSTGTSSSRKSRIVRPKRNAHWIAVTRGSPLLLAPIHEDPDSSDGALQFDADFVREGVKLNRGGRQSQHFKGNSPSCRKRHKCVFRKKEDGVAACYRSLNRR